MPLAAEEPFRNRKQVLGVSFRRLFCSSETKIPNNLSDLPKTN